MFMDEAHKYRGLPLDTLVLPWMIAPRPSITAERKYVLAVNLITEYPVDSCYLARLSGDPVEGGN